MTKWMFSLNRQLRKRADRYQKPFDDFTCTDTADIMKPIQRQPSRIMAHLLLPFPQADPSQNQKSQNFPSKLMTFLHTRIIFTIIVDLHKFFIHFVT
jgi:hypothetical protein